MSCSIRWRPPGGDSWATSSGWRSGSSLTGWRASSGFPPGLFSDRGKVGRPFGRWGGRLEEVQIVVGRRSQAEVEIREGLAEGDRVVVYPGDRVEDGVRFRARNER